MAKLYVHNKHIESIFQLLGEKENDISYSVGWAFANCRKFLELFLKHVKCSVTRPDDVEIRLQTHERGKGYTDFEIVLDGEMHFIVEAKRGWVFPTIAQLTTYASRPSFHSSSAKDKRVFIFNETTSAFTAAYFPHTHVGGSTIEVISWREIKGIAERSIVAGRQAENQLIRDLILYLKKVISMQNVHSNWVYVVSLGSGRPEGWSMSWRDIVNKTGQYFHPVGNGWPKEPPNYIAFRYDGKLQSIHHIDRYEVFRDPSKHFSTAPPATWEWHYLYHLGDAMRPIHEVRAGSKIVRNLRVWAMLDLLLTCTTIEEARDESNVRKEQGS